MSQCQVQQHSLNSDRPCHNDSEADQTQIELPTTGHHSNITSLSTSVPAKVRKYCRTVLLMYVCIVFILSDCRSLPIYAWPAHDLVELKFLSLEGMFGDRFVRLNDQKSENFKLS